MGQEILARSDVARGIAKYIQVTASFCHYLL